MFYIFSALTMSVYSTVSKYIFSPGRRGGGLLLLLLVSHALFAQRPYISASFPRNGASNIECSTFISVSAWFPSEGKIIDPATLTPQAVQLYPKNEPESLIAARLQYNPEFRTLTVTPLEVLAPRTAYVFEINGSLVDDRGFGFMPFRLTFYTGDCLTEPEVAPADSAEEIILPEDSISTPITWLDRFYAYRRGDSIEVRWRMVQEYMNADFTVDRSVDKKEFDIMERIDSQGDSFTPQYYSWLDTLPNEGHNFSPTYPSDIYGKLAYTDTISVFIRKVAFKDRSPRRRTTDRRFYH
ncbi:MAG: Ig-like domain-containing protein [Bacteroidia bacterium]